jgi:hypothetical protein
MHGAIVRSPLRQDHRSHLMKLLFASVAALPLALCACNATPNTSTHDHWNARGIAPSMTKAFLGYDPEKDGRYIDYQYSNKKSIALTLDRHLLNHNPENPFQYEDKRFYAPRLPHSILPRPWEYIGWEGLAWGGIILAATGGSLFLPIPVDSIIGTFSEGGQEEFAEGIRYTFSGGQPAVKSASNLHESIGLKVQPVPGAN